MLNSCHIATKAIRHQQYSADSSISQVDDMYWTHTGTGTTSKKSIKHELLKVFSSIKASKDWTIVKYLYNSYSWALMIILVNTILRNLYIYLVILCFVTLYIHVLKMYYFHVYFICKYFVLKSMCCWYTIIIHHLIFTNVYILYFFLLYCI